MLRLMLVFAIATAAWLLIAGFDWIFGIGLIGGTLGLLAGLLGAIVGVGAGVLGILAGLVGVVMGLGAILLVPALIVMGLLMLFRAA